MGSERARDVRAGGAVGVLCVPPARRLGEAAWAEAGIGRQLVLAITYTPTGASSGSIGMFTHRSSRQRARCERCWRAGSMASRPAERMGRHTASKPFYDLRDPPAPHGRCADGRRAARLGHDTSADVPRQGHGNPARYAKDWSPTATFATAAASALGGGRDGLPFGPGLPDRLGSGGLTGLLWGERCASTPASGN